MQVKRRLIPAKPRNKELYYDKGNSVITGGYSGVGDNSINNSSYWKLVEEEHIAPYILANYPLVSKVEEGENYLRIGDAKLVYDIVNNAVKFVKADGKPLNLYATGEVSAFGAGSGGSGGGGSLVSWGVTTNNFSPLTVEGATKTIALIGHIHTKSDVGLENVLNVASYSKTETDTLLASKFNNPTGTTSQYIRGDGSLANYVDTTYSLMSLAELNTGTATINRVVNSKNLNDWLNGKNYALGNHTHTFASIIGKPITLSGYGITDAYTKTEGNARYLEQMRGGLANLDTNANTGVFNWGDSSIGRPTTWGTLFQISNHLQEFGQGRWNNQLAFGTNQELYFRNNINSATYWNGWKRIWHDGNFTPSHFTTLSTFNTHNNDAVRHITSGERNNWNNKVSRGGDTMSGSLTTPSLITSRLGVFGHYNFAQSQGIWSIGTGFDVSQSTTTLGNQFGLAYSYIDVGGTSLSNQHQIHFVNAGIAGVSVGMADGWIRAKGFISAESVISDSHRIDPRGAQLSSAGWYRCAVGSRNNALGCSLIVMINRNYNNTANESYTFSINVSYGNVVSITQLSGSASYRLITKIRVVSVNSGALTVDLYYNEARSNIVSVGVFGTGYAEPSMPVVSSTTGSITEFTTVDGMKSNSNIVAQGEITAFK